MFLSKAAAKKKLFQDCIEQHNGALYKHALWMTGNKDTAIEMVQEAFFQAWISIDSLKDKNNPLSWLLTILRRSIYREQRRHYRQIETLEQLALLDENDNQSDGYQLLEIYRMLEDLSPAHRDVFLMHHLHGFSYEEIGEQLGIPIGTVMSRLSRTRKDLRKADLFSQNNITSIKKQTGGDL